VKVKVGRFLPAIDPIVLKRQYPEGLIGFNERLCDSLGRNHDRLAFLPRKIEQQSDMPACDHATLADLELPRIDYSQEKFVFLDNFPFFLARRHA